MTADDAHDVGVRERRFRRHVENAYRAGRYRRRRIEHLGVFSRCSRHLYIRELKEVLGDILKTGVTRDDVKTFRKFCRVWLRRGAPLDPKVLWIPAPSIQIIVRQVALAFPSLGVHHTDARLWLSDPFIRSGGAPLTGPIKNPRAFTEWWVPFNLCAHAPEGTPYAAFNRTGFQKEFIDLDDEREA